MKFFVRGTRTRTITVVEQVVGEVRISKETVMRVTDCPAKEDGDSTVWYDSVAEALEYGGKHKLIDDSEVIELEKSETVRWTDVEIEWI